MLQDLLGALAKVKGVPKEQLDPNKPWVQQPSTTIDFDKDKGMPMSQLPLDPQFNEWRFELSVALARWLQYPSGIMFINCAPTVPQGENRRPQINSNGQCVPVTELCVYA